MKSPFSLIAIVIIGFTAQAFSQYGYTPPVPPTPPTPPQASYPTYPSYPASTNSVPPAGAGMDMSYGTPAPSYGAPAYSGYTPQPTAPVSAAMMGMGYSMLSYGYLEGFYQYTDFKDSALDPASGLGLALSAQLFNPVYLKAGFNWARTNGGPNQKNGFDFNSVALGVGAYLPVTHRFHVGCEVGGAYYKLDADKSSLSFSDGAIWVHPGIRVAATSSLELQGGITLGSADNYDSVIFDVGAYWKMLSALDLKVGADFGDASTAWKAGLRVRW